MNLLHLFCRLEVQPPSRDLLKNLQEQNIWKKNSSISSLLLLYHLRLQKTLQRKGPWIVTKSNLSQDFIVHQPRKKNTWKKKLVFRNKQNIWGMAVIPWKMNGWPPKNGGLLQMISLFNWVIFRLQPLILKGVISRNVVPHSNYPVLKAWNRIQHRKGSSDSQSRLKNLKAQAFLRSNNQALYQLLLKCLGVEKVDKQMRQNFFDKKKT